MTPAVAALLCAEDENLCEREGFGVCDREEGGSAANLGEPTAGAAVQVELRRTAAPHDFDVAPQHALGVPGAERFHRGFLGREPAGEMNGWQATLPAVGDLTVGEDSMHEAVAIFFDRLRDAVDVGRVDPQPDDVRHDAQA